MGRSLKDIPKPQEPLWLTAWENFGKIKYMPGLAMFPEDAHAKGDGIANDAAAFASIIAALPAGGTMVLTPGANYRISGLITVDKQLNIFADGATVTFDTDSADQGFRLTASGVRWSGGTLVGPQSTTYTETQCGIFAYGADSSNYISGISIEGVELSGWGNAGIQLQFVEDFQIRGVYAHDVRYVGIGGLSCRRGQVVGAQIFDIHPSGSSSSGDNAYGMFWTKSTGDETTYPEPHDILMESIHVRNVKTWEGVDTHGGYNITLNNFLIENCRFGVAFGSYIGTTLNFKAASYCKITNGIVRNNTSTGVPRAHVGAGIVVNGRRHASIAADRVRGKHNQIANVTIEGYAPYETGSQLGGAGGTGGAVIGITGAIELQYQQGARVDNVTLLDSGVMGIRWISSIESRVSGVKIKDLTGDTWTKAAGLFTFGANPSDGDTITVNTRAYTFRSAPTLDTEIQIGANLTTTLASAATLLNADTDGRVTGCTYASTSTTLTVTADTPGKSFNNNYFPLAASVATVTTMTGGNITSGAVGIYIQALSGDAVPNSGIIRSCEFDIASNPCICATSDVPAMDFLDNETLNPTLAPLYDLTGSGVGGAQNGARYIRRFPPIQCMFNPPSLAPDQTLTFYVPAIGIPSESYGFVTIQAARPLLGVFVQAQCQNNYLVVQIQNPETSSINLADTRWSFSIDQIISDHQHTLSATYTPSGSSSGVTGSLTTGKLPKASGTSALADSIITESSGKIGVGTASPATGAVLHVLSDNNAHGLLVARHQDAASAPAGLMMRRSRGTEGSPANVQNGDDLGGMQVFPRGGASGYFTCGYILARVDGTFSDNTAPPTAWDFATNPANTSASVRLTIDSAGIISATSTTDASSTSAAAFKIAGGLAITKKTFLGDFLLRPSQTGITASTTQTQGQGALTKEINIVSTCANANDTVTLPAAAAGMRVYIRNNGAQTLQIFPASGDAINGAAANASTTLAAGGSVTYHTADTTNWYS